MRSATNESMVQGYVEAAGLHTYNEIVGAGDPLVLLHGGLFPIETIGGLSACLAERYRVYLPERRGSWADAGCGGADHLRGDGQGYGCVSGGGGVGAGGCGGLERWGVGGVVGGDAAARAGAAVGDDRDARQSGWAAGGGEGVSAAGADARHYSAGGERLVRGGVAGRAGALAGGGRQGVADVADRAADGVE